MEDVNPLHATQDVQYLLRTLFVLLLPYCVALRALLRISPNVTRDTFVTLRVILLAFLSHGCRRILRSIYHHIELLLQQ